MIHWSTLNQDFLTLKCVCAAICMCQFDGRPAPAFSQILQWSMWKPSLQKCQVTGWNSLNPPHCWHDNSSFRVEISYYNSAGYMYIHENIWKGKMCRSACAKNVKHYYPQDISSSTIKVGLVTAFGMTVVGTGTIDSTLTLQGEKMWPLCPSTPLNHLVIFRRVPMFFSRFDANTWDTFNADSKTIPEIREVFDTKTYIAGANENCSFPASKMAEWTNHSTVTLSMPMIFLFYQSIPIFFPIPLVVEHGRPNEVAAEPFWNTKFGWF